MVARSSTNRTVVMNRRNRASVEDLTSMGAAVKQQSTSSPGNARSQRTASSYRSSRSSHEATPDPSGVAEWQPLPALVLRDGRIFLFDSAFTGNADPERITARAGVGVVRLPPGASTGW
jgi:hypothetical protein